MGIEKTLFIVFYAELDSALETVWRDSAALAGSFIVWNTQTEAPR
jgi:hypothetical protein